MVPFSSLSKFWIILCKSSKSSKFSTWPTTSATSPAPAPFNTAALLRLAPPSPLWALRQLPLSGGQPSGFPSPMLTLSAEVMASRECSSPPGLGHTHCEHLRQPSVGLHLVPLQLWLATLLYGSLLKVWLLDWNTTPLRAIVGLFYSSPGTRQVQEGGLSP